MTNTAKVWTVIIIVIILAVIGWLIWGSNSYNQPVPEETQEMMGTEENMMTGTSTDEYMGGEMMNASSTVSTTTIMHATSSGMVR